MSDCLFCKIVAGDIPGTPVLETETVYAFNDIVPQAPTHVLVVHKTHTPALSQTESLQLLGEVLAGAREVARKLGLVDYRVVINNGKGAGQTVFHLHLHVLAGRPFGWPPG